MGRPQWARIEPDQWDHLWEQEEPVPRKRKNKGYNKRAHAEHPGVSIQVRREKVVLRYIEPGSVGKNGAPVQRQETVYDSATNEPITSRERAKPFAIAKSKQLAEDRRRQEHDNVTLRADMGWAELQSAHRAELKANNRAAKTLVCYDYLYKVLGGWAARPLRPAALRRSDLRSFVLYLRARAASPSEATVRSIARHFKALLNYGRSSDQPCVRLSDIELRKGLDTGRKTKLAPVALATDELRTILEKAAQYDCERARHDVFPFLSFLLLTGCRRGEAACLRWAPSTPGAAESWCDLEANMLMIYGAKTRVQRVVPLKARRKLRELLKAMKSNTDVDAEPYVFGGAKELAFGDRKRDPDVAARGRDFTSPIRHIRELTKITFRLKDFRSTNATYLANSLMFRNLYGLAGEMGHDYSVLVSAYANCRELPQQQREAHDVADILGVGDLIDTWVAAHSAQQEEGAGSIILLHDPREAGGVRQSSATRC